MPIIQSAKKRVRVARKATSRNVRTKRDINLAVKKLTAKPSSDNFAEAQSAIDTAVKKGLIHKNKAARKKRQLATAAKAAGLKITSKKTAPKKTSDSKPKTATTKKSPVKKSPSKKPVTQKK